MKDDDNRAPQMLGTVICIVAACAVVAALLVLS